MAYPKAAVLVALGWALGGAPTAAKPCLAIATHDDNKLTFRNACGACKRAVWSWGAGQSWFSRGGRVESIWQGT
jgi:hypothetical protein